MTASAAPPVAAFTFAPASPQVGQEVQFNGSATDDGPLTADSYRWDLDGDTQFDDAVGQTPTRVFTSAGPKTVRLRVTDAEALSHQVEKAVPVQAPSNKPPVASFRVFPSVPTAGQVVDLVSVSSDPDGPIAAQHWDLDGDGQFDDAVGASAARSFTVGSKVVRLRVFDASGAQAVQTRTIVVVPRIVTATLLSPFPVVRLVGRLTRTGARIRSLTVSAPKGSSIVVRCSKPSCPLRRISTNRPAHRQGDPLQAPRAAAAGRRGDLGLGHARGQHRQVHPLRDPAPQGAGAARPVPRTRSQAPDPVPGRVTARRTLLTLVLGFALFAGSYGVGRAGAGGKSAQPPAATVPAIGDLEPGKRLPALVELPRQEPPPEPAPPVVTQPEPDPQPDTTPVPVEPVTPTPRPAPTPTPTPTPTPAPPAPGGGFDDSG